MAKTTKTKNELFDEATIKELMNSFGKEENDNDDSVTIVKKILSYEPLEKAVTKFLLQSVTNSIYTLDEYPDDKELFSVIYSMNVFRQIEHVRLPLALTNAIEEKLKNVRTSIVPDITDNLEDRDLVMLQLLSGILHMIVKGTDYNEYINIGEVLLNVGHEVCSDMIIGLETELSRIILNNPNWINYHSNRLVYIITCKVLEDLRFLKLADITITEEYLKDQIQYIIEKYEHLSILL